MTRLKKQIQLINIRTLFLVKIQMILCWFLSVVFKKCVFAQESYRWSNHHLCPRGPRGWLSKHRLIMVACNQWHAMVYTTLVEVYEWGTALSLPWCVELELFELLACTACSASLFQVAEAKALSSRGGRLPISYVQVYKSTSCGSSKSKI